jgi:hypothetical protein
MQLSSVPLVVGGYQALRDRKSVDRVQLGRDVVKPAVHYATYQDRVAKALSESEARKLDRHRSAGRSLSLVSGTMGLTALGLRTPQGAKALASRGVRSARLAQVASREAAATSASNTLGVGAIGVGSAGSFNYAAQQRLERRRDPVSKMVAVRRFHGTTLANARSIKREGFIRPSTDGLGGPGAYTSASREQASGYAHRSGFKEKKKHRVVSFLTPQAGESMGGPSRLYPKGIDAAAPKLLRAPLPKEIRRDDIMSRARKRDIARSVEKALSPKELARAKARARAAGRPYPNAYDNMVAGGMKVEKASVAALGRFNRTYQQIAGPVSRTAPMTALGRKVEARFDRRASGILDEIIPSDFLQSGARIKNKSWLTNEKGRSVSPLGARTFQADITYPHPETGRHRRAGFVEAMVLPTGHVKVNNMKLEPWAQGNGIASGLVREIRGNLGDSKSPGMLWRSAGYTEDKSAMDGGRQGYTAWRQKGIKYVPGYAYGGYAARTITPELSGLSPKDVRAVRSHIRGARLGMTTPERARSKLSPEAQSFLAGKENGQPIDWYGMLPGGRPFLGKTRRAVGYSTLAGAPVYGANKWEEREHPRGSGGVFVRKMVQGEVVKGLPFLAKYGPTGKMIKVLNRHDKDYFNVLLDGRQTAVHQKHLTFVPGQNRPGAVAPASEGPRVPMPDWFKQRVKDNKWDDLAKAIDFRRVSPESEAGYRHLRFERNENRANAVGNAGLTGLSGWMLAHDARRRPVNRPAVAVTSAAMLASGYTSAKSAKIARRRSRSLSRIEAKASDRARAGLYGPGRGLSPVDTTSARYKRYASAMEGVS